ncbi:MAG: isochorismate synthase [Phormidesmis sp.]
MPVVQHETDLFNTTETVRFLKQCQQQVAQAGKAKIASLSFEVEPISAWVVLQTLKRPHQRHFYYDPPHQPSIVGLDVVIDNSAEGPTRFAQTQAFVQHWRSRFVYAPPRQPTAEQPRPPLGHFFCSATFFDSATSGQSSSQSSGQSSGFDPAYVFVPRVQVVTQAAASVVTFNFLITAEAEIAQQVDQSYRQLRQLAGVVATRRTSGATPKVVTKDVAGFERAVASVLHSVKKGPLHKVVLADVLDVVAPQAIDEVRSLQALRQNHPDCTVFSLSNGQGQAFIGASPERLLSITQGRLTTDALAGSASRSGIKGIDQQLAQSLLHSKKERYEHRVVVEFIVQQLRSLGLTPRYTPSPQLLQLLHIQHLHTPISARLNPKTISPLEILAKLHPTPAVAGLPRQLACQLIRQHETFDRGLYAAPLGWIDTEGNSEFVVGIRSALIDGCKARLYAGAGIVAGSEPAKELAEIKLKLQTLLNALV